MNKNIFDIYEMTYLFLYLFFRPSRVTDL